MVSANPASSSQPLNGVSVSKQIVILSEEAYRSFFFQRHSYANSRDFIFLPVSYIGPEFESRIRQNEINNPKFNFLNPGDPYHAYFQQKIADIKEQDGKGENARKE